MNRLRFQNDNIEKLTNLGYWEWCPNTNEATFSAGFLRIFSFLKEDVSPTSILAYLKNNLPEKDFFEFTQFLKDLKNNKSKQTKTFAFPIREEFLYFELNAFGTEHTDITYIAGTIQETTEKVKYNKLKEKELNFEKKVANIASRFVNEENFELAITTTLNELGILCEADRVSLLKINNNSLTQEFEWKGDKQNACCIFDENIGNDEIKFFIDYLKEKKHIYFQNINDLPERLPNIKANALKFGVESFIISSIQKDNRTVGALMLGKTDKNNKWDFSDIHMTKMTSLILSNALKQNILYKSIKDSEKRLKFALLAGNLGTYEIHMPSNTRIFDERSANTFGYSNHTINKISNWFENNLHSDFTEEFDTCLTNCIEGSKNYYEFEYKIKCNDGSYKWINDWGIVTEVNSEGEALRIVGVIQDISQRKNVEEALIFAKEKAEENENLKTAFLANVSHEIRTPMNGISGFAELLYHNMVSDCDKHRYLEIIYKNSNRLLTLINNILDISKLETNQLQLFDKPYSVAELINELMKKLNPQIEQKVLINFEIDNKLSDQDFMLCTDEARLKQILTNLIENALKFTSEGFIKLTISLNESDELLFSVEDTGNGISKEFQKRLFNRFSQSDFTISQNIGGTGLGLPISKGLVEAMGGSLWVKSLKGVGSTFSFTLPLKTVEVIAKK